MKVKESNNNLRANISALARDYKVTRKTIMKAEGELIRAGRLIDPAVIVRDKDMPSGPGTITLSDLDAFMLLQIHHTEPSTSLRGSAAYTAQPEQSSPHQPSLNSSTPNLK